MSDNSGQVVTFYLGEEIFGIELDFVREIIRLPELVAIPGTPHYFSGLANLRGSLLPVIDGRLRFGLPSGSLTEAARVIVLESAGKSLGCIVDRMSGVIQMENVEEEPLQLSGGREYISRVLRPNESAKIVMLINLQVLLGQEDQAEPEGYNPGTAAGFFSEQKTAQGHEQAGREIKQFVGFKLADEEYAVALEHVQEIVRVPGQISRSPGVPPYVDGLFVLRQKTIPLVNLRQLFLLPERPYDERSRVLVIRSASGQPPYGLGVDAVTEVMRFYTDEIEPMPPLLGQDVSESLLGIYKPAGGERLVYLFDPTGKLHVDELGTGVDNTGSVQSADKTQHVSEDDEEEMYVIFTLHSEEYALPVQKVQEIIRLPELVEVPRAPEYIAGVVNLRGSILTVIDLRRKLGLPIRQNDEGSRIVVVEMDGMAAGLVVDAVKEVRRIGHAQMEEVPAVLQSQMVSCYLRGVIRQAAEGKTILLLSIEQVLTAQEKQEVAGVAAACLGEEQPAPAADSGEDTITDAQAEDQGTDS